jgi:uncharacterized membrane protein YccC
LAVQVLQNAATENRLASVEAFMREMGYQPAVQELWKRAGAEPAHLRLVRGTATLRTTLVQRLLEELASVEEADGDLYDRLDALVGFGSAVAEAVAKARAGGLRPLGKALMMVRDGVKHMRAEDLRDLQIAAVRRVLDRLASRDPSRDDLVEIDRELLAVELDWVPVVAGVGEGE